MDKKEQKVIKFKKTFAWDWDEALLKAWKRLKTIFRKEK